MDNYKTDIVFRIDSFGVFALFPHEVCDHLGHVTTYQHVGQHSSANYIHCIQKSKKATPEQYKPLLAELKERGYDVNIVYRQNHNVGIRIVGDLKR